MVDFTTGAPVAGDLSVRWIHGRERDPRIQVHRYDEHTFVLRQNMAVHWEAPFLYLFCGNDRALLLDTGADPDLFPLRDTVDGLLDGPQFADRPGTTVVMTSRPGRDYPIGVSSQPDEPPLQLSVSQLTAIRDAAARVADRPGAHRLDHAIIFNGPCRGARRWHRVRAAWHRLRT